MRRTYPLLVAALLALLLAGCGAGSNHNGTIDVPGSTSSAAPSLGIEPSGTAGIEASPSPNDQPLVTSGDAGQTLKDAATEVVGSLRERDLSTLISWIDPKQGLRFSPSSHIDADKDLVFAPDKLPTFKDATKLKWGIADGSGEPIELTFRDYYEKYVYNKDFADAPNVNVNKIVGTGTVEFNAKQAYPNASFVEYHFPGFDEKLEGMDWQSLVLVFVPEGKDWKLVGIVHGQWTT